MSCTSHFVLPVYGCEKGCCVDVVLILDEEKGSQHPALCLNLESPNPGTSISQVLTRMWDQPLQNKQGIKVTGCTVEQLVERRTSWV